ncbi:MAG: type II toxin-antitoxin system VapC family toxin [Deltaproteobacteria bacterium]|nr:type II toxin-antitoxin system VapC family toxin [Deltaproteobacteria bacterium]
MRRLLDTNICIAYLHRNDPGVVQKFKDSKPGDFLLCSVVKAELICGARRSQRVSENMHRLSAFFANFESLSFDDKAAEFYGVNRALLSKNGTLIGSNDLLIVSVALAHDLTVVTRNTDEFMRVPGLKIEVW